MKYFRCANIEIPLCFVQSISWTKTARTIQHTGGYISARGFEAAEISVKLHYDFATASALGVDAKKVYNDMNGIVTDRMSPSGVVYIDTYPIYPELEFTPTSINKTYISDTAKNDIIELDFVLSGVKAVKEVNRERLLELPPSVEIPRLTMTANGKSRVIQDMFSVNEFITTPDSISLVIDIGTDTSILSRDGFQKDILDGGYITAELPQGTTKYYIITADLVDNILSISASVLPSSSQKIICKTYHDISLSSVIKDLASLADIECRCDISSRITHYQAYGTPIQCIRELQGSAGFLLSWRQGVMICVDVPTSIEASRYIDYDTIQQDGANEPISGCYWSDGIIRHIYGVINNNSIRIQSVFRSADSSFALKCIKYARYNNNTIVVTADLMPDIDTHSVIGVRSNDQVVSCMVDWYEMDWLNNTMRLELKYL